MYLFHVTTKRCYNEKNSGIKSWATNWKINKYMKQTNRFAHKINVLRSSAQLGSTTLSTVNNIFLFKDSDVLLGVCSTGKELHLQWDPVHVYLEKTHIKLSGDSSKVSGLNPYCHLFPSFYKCIPNKRVTNWKSSQSTKRYHFTANKLDHQMGGRQI